MNRAEARNRYIVLALLILLFAITYLDRVCISVAGPRMQEDLHISPAAWGWVSAVFTLAYCIFEIPRLSPKPNFHAPVLFLALCGGV